MIGKRLRKANQIAKKRQRQWPAAEIALGYYRKWNQTCTCPICKKARYKDKGKRKEMTKYVKLEQI